MKKLPHRTTAEGYRTEKARLEFPLPSRGGLPPYPPRSVSVVFSFSRSSLWGDRLVVSFCLERVRLRASLPPYLPSGAHPQGVATSGKATAQKKPRKSAEKRRTTFAVGRSPTRGGALRQGWRTEPAQKSAVARSPSETKKNTHFRQAKMLFFARWGAGSGWGFSVSACTEPEKPIFLFHPGFELADRKRPASTKPY